MTSIGIVQTHERIKQVLLQFREVGWNRIYRTDNNFDNVTLVHKGMDDKEYYLDIQLPQGFPKEEGPSYSSTDLPPEDAAYFKWILGRSRLRDLYSGFVDRINWYSPLRRVLKDLDSNAWVLDPPPPVVGLQHRFRRVVVSKSVSLQITLDLHEPDSLPDLKFFGPDDKVRPLREALSKNNHNFDSDYTIVQNIENMLDLKFPLPPETSGMGGDFNVECGICYSYRLGDALPVKSCDQNPNCRRLFHQECLFEWLRSLPDFRQSFQTIFGKCPYCDTQISCKMPK